MGYTVLHAPGLTGTLASSQHVGPRVRIRFRGEGKGRDRVTHQNDT